VKEVEKVNVSNQGSINSFSM